MQNLTFSVVFHSPENLGHRCLRVFNMGIKLLLASQVKAGQRGTAAATVTAFLFLKYSLVNMDKTGVNILQTTTTIFCTKKLKNRAVQV